MPEEIKCPDCGSINIEEIPYKAAVGPGGANGELPEEAEYRKYKCLDCGLAFFESDLRE
jgi:DNA-directed RNA polymerase subunit RPC12/RpoP